MGKQAAIILIATMAACTDESQSISGAQRIAPYAAGETGWVGATMVEFGNGILYYSALAPDRGTLMRVDGVVATELAALSGSPSAIERRGSIVLFAGSGAQGTGIWRTDGTASGTSLVHEIPGLHVNWSNARIIGGRYFLETGSELWVSDGTPAGTERLATGSLMRGLGDLDGRAAVLHQAPTGRGWDLTTSDGTIAGTAVATTIDDAICQALVTLPRARTRSQTSGLAFTTCEGRLWRTDGTASGTFMIDEAPGIWYGWPEHPDRFYYSTFDLAGSSVTSVVLWETDGVTVSHVADIDTIFGGIGTVDGTMFAGSSDGVWRIGGGRPAELVHPLLDAGPPVAVADRVLVYEGNEDGHSRMWRNDGGPEGLYYVEGVTDPYFFTRGGEHLYFAAEPENESGVGYDLWAIPIARLVAP